MSTTETKSAMKIIVPNSYQEFSRGNSNGMRVYRIFEINRENINDTLQFLPKYVVATKNQKLGTPTKECLLIVEL